MDKPHRKPWPKSKTSNISKHSPSPLHHTVLLGRARFTAQPLSALLPSLRSKRFRASSLTKLGREQKKEWRGRGRGKKEPLARKPHDFEKLSSPTNAASDWCGASSVDCLALKTSIKPGMLCLRASQIWSHLICGRRLQMLWTDIYLNRVCAKVYEIRVFKVYLEIEQWRQGKANLLGMTAWGSDWKKTNVLFVGDNINVNQNISTQH